MNQLMNHNLTLRSIIDNSTSLDISCAINLDSIDLVLRECLSIDEMREAGSFFTGQKLAAATVNLFSVAITFDSVILDPTCGAGNLLIECSRRLGVENTLSATLIKWSKVLRGYDLHASFIEATKLRLVIEALSRGVEKDCDIECAISFFKNIKVKDTLSVTKQEVSGVTHTILNPPFSIWKSPNKNYWKNGKINAAGMVFDHYLRILPEHSVFSAILPDVLRSGSRYDNFRSFCSIKSEAFCKVWGRFNDKTDVDVFHLNGKIIKQGESNIFWQEKVQDTYLQLSEKYDVRVGPLVAYRDPEIGIEYAYLHSKNITSWEVVTEVNERRRYKGTAIEPPFVIVKRTSSPSDKYRASATLINIGEKAAVENHLIIIKPFNNKLADCKKLLKLLKREKTNEFLNKRIRLRHLTVSAVKSIPIE